MNPLDNFHRMMRGDDPQWAPLEVPLAEPVRDRLVELHGSDLIAALGQDFVGIGARWPGDAAAWRDAYETLGVGLPAHAEVGGGGNVILRPDPATLGAASHLVEKFFPLAELTGVEQLERLPWPDLEAGPANAAELRGKVESIHTRGLVAVAALECTVFESAWYLRGMDQLFMDMIEGGAVGRWLLDFMTRRSVQAAIAYCHAGADAIRLGDDVGMQTGMMMSVEMWREHLKPRLQQVIDAIRAHQREHIWIRYHSDGDIRAILGDLIEMGVDIINPVQPECMPAGEVFAAYGDRVAFWGMIGTQTTMPYGTPDDVRERVAWLVDQARAGVRLVAAPTHVLEPDVPMANIEALRTAPRTIRG